MKSIIFAALALFPALSFGASFNDNFTVAPMRYESKMKIGETKEFTIKISNDMKKKRLAGYELSIQEFVFDKDGKIQLNPTTKNSRSLLPYSRISLKQINLEGGKEVVAKLVITVPKDYKFGSGYLAYKLAPEKDLKKKGAGFGFNKNLIGFVAINIEENTKKLADLSAFSFKNGKLTVDVGNAGESFLKLSGKAVVLQGTKKIAEFDLIDGYNRDSFLIIPGLTRHLSTIIPSSIKVTKGMKVNVIVSDISSNYVYLKEFNLKD